MNFVKTSVATLLTASFVLTGCSTNTGQEYSADVYQANQLNTKQETKTINIISILPARVAVDNSSNRKAAQTAGTVLGALAGAVIGYQAGYSNKNATVGGVGGATIGAMAGSTVDDTVLVEGVSLTYKEGTKVYTSTQVGKQCMFTPGTAVVITTEYNETRVQPNATCPTK